MDSIKWKKKNSDKTTISAYCCAVAILAMRYVLF